MLGYELERGKHGQPEIRGYSKEYLEASSPRREQIKDHLREQGIDSAAAAQIAAHHTRDRKELLSQGEVLHRHRELAAQYGHQAIGSWPTLASTVTSECRTLRLRRRVLSPGRAIMYSSGQRCTMVAQFWKQRWRSLGETT